MEDGMEIKPFATSFKEQQWMESVKLTRESGPHPQTADNGIP